MNERSEGMDAEEPSTRVTLVAGLLMVLLTAGCAGVKPSPPIASPPVASPFNTSPQAGSDTVASAAPPAAPTSSAINPPAPTPTQSGAASASAPVTAPSASASRSQTGTTTPQPAAKAAPPARAPATKKDATPPDAKQKAPPLDLAALETRLKDTNAIGVLTKIALKNQVDDLLGEFRAFYQRKLQTTLAELRRSYDLLVLKVLTLLQDSDPQLASAIVASREAIWGNLSDPVKFATI